VLIPGDISWATYINKAEEDFKFISDLPGRKLLSRGNHDYWWTTMKKMEEFFAEKGFTNMEFVRTNVVEVEDCLITGTRGWMIETKESIEGSDNRKIYEREKLRIKMCIDVLNEADPGHAKKHILMIHYPPITAKQDFTEFAEMMAQGGIDICVYGHLHGSAHKKAFEGDFEGMRLICASADYADFKPVRIL
jgi:predicted phosphohydrolase